MKQQEIIELFKSEGYELDPVINIFAIRNKVIDNKFTDTLYCVTNNQIKSWTVTTIPGTKSLIDPVNRAGTAILVPGQYKDVYAIDLHKNKYKALCQRLGPVRVYRDSNKDSKIDLNPKTIQSGFFGINIHKAGTNSTLVDGWSAGCTVFKRSADFDEFMKIVESVRELKKNKYTYTLFQAK